MTLRGRNDAPVCPRIERLRFRAEPAVRIGAFKVGDVLDFFDAHVVVNLSPRFARGRASGCLPGTTGTLRFGVAAVAEVAGPSCLRARRTRPERMDDARRDVVLAVLAVGTAQDHATFDFNGHERSVRMIDGAQERSQERVTLPRIDCGDQGFRPSVVQTDGYAHSSFSMAAHARHHA